MQNMQEIVNHVSNRIVGNSNFLEKCDALTDAVVYACGECVQGDIAEFGTMSGRTAIALASAMVVFAQSMSHQPVQAGQAKQLWLFDSFEGLPEARFEVDQKSPMVSAGIWGKNTCRGLSPEQLYNLVKQVLGNREVKIIKGWFKDTVSNIQGDTRFALVHIDGDLYESAIDVLDGLFAKKMISKGAILLFDDWYCNRSDPALGEQRAWNEVVGKFLIKYTDLGMYGGTGNRFIIHDYT